MKRISLLLFKEFKKNTVLITAYIIYLLLVLAVSVYASLFMFEKLSSTDFFDGVQITDYRSFAFCFLFAYFI